MKDTTKVIEIVETPQLGTTWKPIIGAETESLLRNLDITEQNRKKITDETARILARCVPPTTNDRTDTGLVVGYVQSGKTMSFTTVAAMARDNCYQLIIVIAGTSIPLFEQSVSRLRRDLRLEDRPDRKWLLFVNPSLRDRNISAIKDTLMDWQDETILPEERQTVLITVMKNHTHLKKLYGVLESFGIDWHSVPSLIIDDEADQASLNTMIQDGEESTTFKRITAIRDRLPNHTFLQYTATPQGPLLINIINVLSPFFAEVLTPGDEYVGGKDFFIDNPALLERIHQSELNIQDDPPESLKDAMKIFFVGATAGRILQNSGRNRSMMIHPSIRRVRHSRFYVWAKEIKDRWLETLSLTGNDPDKYELVSEFKDSYLDLAKTADDIPDFNLIIKHLPTTIRKTVIEEVNSSRGRTPTIDWSRSYSYILVGGQAMDRGFTVEGLTVTYMPRSVGVGNADTVQQRARFFGYKRKYLGYCRIFVDQANMQAYKDYVEHEEDIRTHLIEHRNTGKPLTEWKRAFLMPRQLRPTRRNILDVDYIQENLNDEWYYPRSPHESKTAVNDNKKLIDDYISNINFHHDIGHPDRTIVMKHSVNESISLEHVYKYLLTNYRVSNPRDSRKFTGLLLQVRNYVEKYRTEKCTLYLMSSDISTSRRNWQIRERGLDDNGEIPVLFQGAHPDHRGSIYPGDRNIGDHTRLIIQIHRLRIINDGKELAQDLYNLAIWIPAKMSNSWLVQNQGGIVK